MDIEWISAIADSAAAIMAFMAVAISIAGVFLSKRFHIDNTKSSTLEQQYNAFNELGVLRIENQSLSHLLEVQENYAETLTLVKTALNNPSSQAKAEIILKERALAMYIFQIFEHTYYQYLHAQENKNSKKELLLNDVLRYFTKRLLVNPRLLYFWSKSGGNLCTYFEDDTKKYYYQEIAVKSEKMQNTMDEVGPFSQKSEVSDWKIQNNKVLNVEERQKYWEKTHCEDGYESVWSMTDDIGIRDKIITELSALKSAQNILIPGCGSKVELQNAIAQKFPNSTILCTDFLGVIEVAKKQQNQSNIDYKALNSTDLGFENEWDAVIVVNSILSEDDTENQDIFASIHKSLKSGGAIIGFFPTIYASLDIAYLEKNEQRKALIDIEKSSFYEEKQKIWQIFYTPLRLRAAILNVGFLIDKVEIYFCDSDYFYNHSKKYYGISDPNLPLYEHFVLAYKNQKPNNLALKSTFRF